MKSKKSLFFCVGGALMLLLGACGNKIASEADCQKFADHIMELGLKDVPEGPAADMAKKILQDNSAAIVSKCVEQKVPKDTLDCAIKAQTMEEAGKCGAPTN